MNCTGNTFLFRVIYRDVLNMRGYNGVVVPAKTLRMMTDLVKKYFLFVFLLFFGITVNGHQLDAIDVVGSASNRGDGEPSRSAFFKVNAGIEFLNTLRLGDYDYFIEQVDRHVYARPSFNSILPAFDGPVLSGVLTDAMRQLPGGGKIFISEGLYENVDTIRVPYSNILIEGAGRYRTKIKMKDGMDIGKTIHYGFFQVRNVDHFVLKDLELDGNGSGQTKIDDGTTVTAICNGIHFYSSKNSRVENCFIHDFTMFGVRAHGTTHYLKIDNCHFKDNYWNNVTFSLGTDYCEVNETVLEGASDVGIALYARNATVSNCLIKYVTGSRGSGNTRVGISFESHVGYPGPRYHKVYNTVIKGNGMIAGIMSNKMEGGSTGCIIDGCYIDSCHYGISNYGDSMKIVNNTILNTSLVGVYVNKGDYNYIANNEIQARVNAYALWFWYDDGDGSTYNTVSNNKLRGGRYAYPIRIGPGCNYNRILNNLLYVQDAPGIIQDDGTGTVLSNNFDGTNSRRIPDTR